MALTYSEMIPLGSNAYPFTLKGIDGKDYSLEDLAKNKKAILIMFICNHCPYVKAIENRISKLSKFFKNEPVQFIGICSNDSINYPEDSKENLLLQAKRAQFDFPYLIDETQEVAKNYGAVCTPDFFLFDSNLKLSYRGRLDDSWKDETKVTKEELKDAIIKLLNGETPDPHQLPSLGCSIKWK
jgi:peroxiredoxin